MNKVNQNRKTSRVQFKTLIVLFLLLLSGSLKSHAFQLTNQAEISVITCSPGNEVYSVYGHSAIRVKDDVYKYDVAFNYGIFDFSAPNFLYRFAAGQTDYLLGAYQFDDFVQQYQRDKRSVYEQTLNLTQNEKQKIFDFLIWNAKPENRVYRYNFFFDNCATRVRDVVADNIEGGVTFKEEKQSHKTLRQLVDDYHGKLLWLTFGIDLAVSSESDREATFYEEMLLPDYLMNYFAEATKTNGNVPLVQPTRIVYKAPAQEYKSFKAGSPFVVFFILTLLVGFLSYGQFRKHKMKPGLDYIIYGMTGLTGIILSWLALFSEHPAMSPNYNILWALPLNLLFALALIVKKWRPAIKYYHLFISAWLILFICGSPFIPQYFHLAFYPIIVLVLCRSVLHSLLIMKMKVAGKS